MRTMARTITDLDVTDVTDSILNTYIKDGYLRLMSLERRWPWLEASYTLTAIAGTQAYTLSGVGDIEEITSILHDDDVSGRLTWCGHQSAEDVWYGTTSGVPQNWSKWGTSIYLWPTPDAAYSMSVRAYRNPVNWTASDTVECDADTAFHIALVYYVVAMMYQLQEDPEQAALYRRSFDEAVTMARGEAMRLPQSGALILHGGYRRTWDRFRNKTIPQ